MVHAIYFVPADAPDLGFDTTGVISTSLRSTNGYLAAETGGSRLRVDEFSGSPDITFFQSTQRAGIRGGHPGISYDSIVRELRDAGFTSPNKIYAIYVEGPPDSGKICGKAQLPGRYAVVWLQECGYPSPQRYSALRRRLWQLLYFPTGHPWKSGSAIYADLSMLHEILHSLGHVDGEAAPPARRGHVHCSFWSRIHLFGGKGDLMQDCGSGLRIDPNHRFYFRHGRQGCPDLSLSVFLEPTPADAELPPPSVTLQMTGPLELSVGDRAAFSVTPYWPSQVMATCQGVPAWSTAPQNVAGIDSHGVATGLSPGTTTVTATYPSGMSISVQLRVVSRQSR